MSYFIFEKTFKDLWFFKGRSLSFIAWVCPLLKPLSKNQDQYIFFEDDDVSCIYFLKKGKAGYVLPRQNNLLYVTLSEGFQFGLTCIVGSFMQQGKQAFDIDNWISRRDQIKRQFTIQCQGDCESLTFSINDLNQMKNEFYEIYTELFENSLTILRRMIRIKVRAIQKHQQMTNRDQ